MNVLCVIPARYASTRLPGKPLKDIAGKPMICRVYERAAKASRVAAAIVATDDSRIYDAVLQHGGKAVMTRKDHPTGTDRLAEVAEKYPDVDLIINVQGDEPLIEPKLIDELAAAFDGDADLQMATVCTEITDEAEQQNPNNVKVVMDKQGYALYFSRSLMPYPRVKPARSMSQAAEVLMVPSGCANRGASAGKVAACSASTTGLVKNDPALQVS